MRVTALFFLYLLLCLVLAALLTYPLLATGWLELEPHRLMGRLAQAIILLGIWPLLSHLRLLDRGSLGYGVTGSELRRAVVLGWVQGILILLALVGMLLVLQIRVPDQTLDPWGTLAAKAVQAMVGGLLVGLLEETFFRGALYTALRRRDGMVAAMLWSSGLYAILHFMKPGALPEGMDFDWLGSLWMFVRVFVDLFQWEHLSSLVVLFMAGLFLSLVRERTGHIGWCIGLHAGWVLVIQVTRRLTDGDAANPLAFLVGDYDGTIGWLAAAWIALLAALYWVWSGRRPA